MSILETSHLEMAQLSEIASQIENMSYNKVAFIGSCTDLNLGKPG